MIHVWVGIDTISKKSWLFLILSEFVKGFSWLLYYRASQYRIYFTRGINDKLSLVITIIMAVIFLHEQLIIKMILGTFVMIL